jgi:hypothetical protein
MGNALGKIQEFESSEPRRALAHRLCRCEGRSMPTRDSLMLHLSPSYHYQPGLIIRLDAASDGVGDAVEVVFSAFDHDVGPRMNQHGEARLTPGEEHDEYRHEHTRSHERPDNAATYGPIAQIYGRRRRRGAQRATARERIAELPRKRRSAASRRSPTRRIARAFVSS